MILQSESIDEVMETARINLEMIQAIRVYREQNCPIEIFLKHLAGGDIESAFEDTQTGSQDHLKCSEYQTGRDRFKRTIQLNNHFREKIGGMAPGGNSDQDMEGGADPVRDLTAGMKIQEVKNNLEHLLILHKELTDNLLVRVKENRL